MDPNLFHLDWQRTVEVLAAIVVLSFVVERALALLFEHRAFVRAFDRRGVKEPIAFLVALGACLYWDFDAVSMIILQEKTSLAGAVLTAGVIAGGSKGAIKLFRDVLGFKSRAYAEYEKELASKTSA